MTGEDYLTELEALLNAEARAKIAVAICRERAKLRFYNGIESEYDYMAPEAREFVDAGEWCSTSEARDFLKWEKSSKRFLQVMRESGVRLDQTGRYLKIHRMSLYQWNERRLAEAIADEENGKTSATKKRQLGSAGDVP